MPSTTPVKIPRAVAASQCPHEHRAIGHQGGQQEGTHCLHCSHPPASPSARLTAVATSRREPRRARSSTWTWMPSTPSVEQRDRPELSGRPMVGAGAVTAAARGWSRPAPHNPRARGAFGHADHARPSSVVPTCRCSRAPRMDRYVASVAKECDRSSREVTEQVELAVPRRAYSRRHPEQLGNRRGQAGAAPQGRDRCRTASLLLAGVGPSKLVAKIASDVILPDGFLAVPPRGRGRFSPRRLPVGRLWGVGPKTGARLAELNIKTVEDVRRGHRTRSPSASEGTEPIWLALALSDDDAPWRPEREAKSRGSESLPRGRMERGASATPCTRMSWSSPQNWLPGTRARTVTRFPLRRLRTITCSRSFRHPVQEAATSTR